MSKQNDAVAVFIADGVGSLSLLIPATGATPEETKTFAAARKIVGDEPIIFRQVGNDARKSSVAVNEAVVVKAVRLLAKKPSEFYRIYQDVKLLKVRCPYCDFVTESNTAADQAALAEHIADNHAEDEKDERE